MFAKVRLALALLLLVVRVSAIVYRVHLKPNPKPVPAPAWHHTGLPVRASQLVGKGRIYLIQLGKHTDPYTAVDLAEWLRDTYALDVQVLTAMPLDPAAWDKSRHRYIAEQISAQIKREHPELAVDPQRLADRSYRCRHVLRDGEAKQHLL